MFKGDRSIALIGVPTSAGAYAPGQEKTPDALRLAGLVEFLNGQNILVRDLKNVVGWRWEVDKANRRAMNVDKVAIVAKALAEKVHEAVMKDEKVLVLGGDCTIELGCVAGCLNKSPNIGLIYIDLDTDLNTPDSVVDGALDWMGVAHLLGVDGTNRNLASIANRFPMLQPRQVHFFGNGNMTSFERGIIDQFHISEILIDDVIKDPAGAAKKIVDGWAVQFDQILIHLDVDVLNYVDMQLAENYRRDKGLTFDQLMDALSEFLEIPNWSVLTITEINPDHGAADGSTLKIFSERLAAVIGKSFGQSKR